MDYSGKRVTVMGLGSRGGGSGVARYLAERSAIVTVTDLRDGSSLADGIAELNDLPIRYVLGRHDPADFTPANADLVVRNPAVRREAEMLATARASGVPVTMEIPLFLHDVPATVIGITGTKGKTSTSFLCAEMLRSMDASTVLAGNMGISALGSLVGISSDTPVVLEISNWQLEGMDDAQIGPEIALVTNISEDHLNTYASYADYAAIKRSIGHHLAEDNWLVLNADDDLASGAANETRGQVAWFGWGWRGEPGVWASEHELLVSITGDPSVIPWPAHDRWKNRVNQINAAAAAAAARLRGATDQQIAAGLASFAGVPHRQEEIATIDGVRYINDTAATAPAAVIASLQSHAGERVHLIAGGADKHLDLHPLAVAIAAGATSTVLLDGSATAALNSLLEIECGRQSDVVSSMDAAVGVAAAAAQPGDVVLLSPGCASFGLFQDEFDRGDQFRRAVLSLQRRAQE